MTIQELHQQSSLAFDEIAQSLPLQCGQGCSQCCVDDLTVLPVEAERIRSQANMSGEHPHPVGACAFLDGGQRCRIYDVRPYVCRTQGLPLRWFTLDDDDEVVEERDICPLNAGVGELHELDDDVLWTLGPTEEALLDLQDEAGPGPRVSLRQLFDELV